MDNGGASANKKRNEDGGERPGQQRPPSSAESLTHLSPSRRSPPNNWPMQKDYSQIMLSYLACVASVLPIKQYFHLIPITICVVTICLGLLRGVDGVGGWIMVAGGG